MYYINLPLQQLKLLQSKTNRFFRVDRNKLQRINIHMEYHIVNFINYLIENAPTTDFVNIKYTFVNSNC